MGVLPPRAGDAHRKSADHHPKRKRLVRNSKDLIMEHVVADERQLVPALRQRDRAEHKEPEVAGEKRRGSTQSDEGVRNHECLNVPAHAQFVKTALLYVLKQRALLGLVLAGALRRRYAANQVRRESLAHFGQVPHAKNVGRVPAGPRGNHIATRVRRVEPGRVVHKVVDDQPQVVLVVMLRDFVHRIQLELGVGRHWLRVQEPKLRLLRMRRPRRSLATLAHRIQSRQRQRYDYAAAFNARHGKGVGCLLRHLRHVLGSGYAMTQMVGSFVAICLWLTDENRPLSAKFGELSRPTNRLLRLTCCSFSPTSTNKKWND